MGFQPMPDAPLGATGWKPVVRDRPGATPLQRRQPLSAQPPGVLRVGGARVEWRSTLMTRPPGTRRPPAEAFTSASRPMSFGPPPAAAPGGRLGTRGSLGSRVDVGEHLTADAGDRAHGVVLRAPGEDGGREESAPRARGGQG